MSEWWFHLKRLLIRQFWIYLQYSLSPRRKWNLNQVLFLQSPLYFIFLCQLLLLSLKLYSCPKSWEYHNPLRLGSKMTQIFCAVGILSHPPSFPFALLNNDTNHVSLLTMLSCMKCFIALHCLTLHCSFCRQQEHWWFLDSRQQHKRVDDRLGREQWSRQWAIGGGVITIVQGRRDSATIRGGKEKYNNQLWLMGGSKRRGKAITMMIAASKMVEALMMTKRTTKGGAK